MFYVIIDNERALMVTNFINVNEREEGNLLELIDNYYELIPVLEEEENVDNKILNIFFEKGNGVYLELLDLQTKTVVMEDFIEQSEVDEVIGM